MFGSEVIEVGIGLALLFLFMSLIANALRELIGSIFKSRAKDLERGLVELLRASATGAHTSGGTARDYVAELYRHPLIASLYKGDYKPGTRNLPSYIPRQSFALALIDVVADASRTGQALSMGTLRASLVAGGKPDDVQRVLITAIDTARGDLERTRTAVEDWYDATMDRVAGWYTRRTSVILLCIGFSAAAAFNVDSITVGRRLLEDKPLREAIVAQAENAVPSPSPTPAAQTGAEPDLGELRHLATQFNRIGFPIGWTQGSDGWPYPTPQACRPLVTAESSAAAACRIGWPEMALTVLGWVITALAIMLGAPFWFDVLNKFMVVRSTIKPREKSPDEASPDRGPSPRVGF